MAAAQRLENVRTRVPIPIPEPGVLELQRAVTRSIMGNIPGLPESTKLKMCLPKVMRSYANWDPLYQSENIHWYDEYIARHAVLSTSWLEQPTVIIDGAVMRREICGMAFRTGETQVIAPLDDGSVCLWDIRPFDGFHNSRRCQITARSKPGLLLASSSTYGAEKTSLGNADIAVPSVVECVSIDSTRNRGYFAVEKGLNEVDLSTLQLISHQEFESSIAALSEISPGVPMTVATNPSLHVHDPRVTQRKSSDASLVRLESTMACYSLPPPSKSLYQVLRSEKSLYGPHQGPLAIVHLPSSTGSHDAQHGAIYVAGRDPSILVYDRRVFPKLSHTIHSGAHLSSLAVISPPSSGSVISSSGDPQCKIIACGEYKGKGSLELYDPAPFATLPSQAKSPMHFKNRTSASSSKLLSVTSHGARILFSDGNGVLKWVERDGSTLVRHWNINSRQPHTNERGIFANFRGVDEHVARKVLRTGDASSSDDSVLFWTGEKIGLVGFRPEPKLEQDERKEKAEGETDLAETAEIYRERMRRALNRQADEVRFVRGLGLGG